MRVRVVVGEGEVGVVETVDVFYIGVYLHLGQWTRLAGELQSHLLEMVTVDMCVAEGVDEITVLEAAHLCYHHRQQCVRCDVERHAEEYVGGTLVELARESSVGHVELEKYVTRRQGHLFDVGHVPRAYEQAARVGVALYLVYQLCYLVDAVAVGAGPRAPLLAVHGSEVAVAVGPFVPDGNTVVVQILYVGVAFQEPQQLVYNGAQVQFLGGEQRESLVEVETHLVAEHAACAGARAVHLVGAVVHHMTEQVKVLFHVFRFFYPQTALRLSGVTESKPLWGIIVFVLFFIILFFLPKAEAIYKIYKIS